MDSLQNRKDYEKIFNYKKPGVAVSVTPGLGAGLDLDQFIQMFQFKKNRRAEAFRHHLIREEQEGYVNHRFNKGLVRKLTGLSSPELDSFMKEYRPTYLMATQMNDLEFGQFIVEAYKYFKAGVKVDKTLFRREYEE